RAIHSFTLGKMPRNQTVFISLKKLKKPQKTLAENSDVSVFPMALPVPGCAVFLKHGVTENTKDSLQVS
ncbi:MAG: hypothetical protein RL069_2847, partial [Planctomycetota bacterium]